VCAQCFRPFPDGIFYEFEGRKYCEHDFHVLFAPCCGRCGEFIVGRVIKGMLACMQIYANFVCILAMNNSWHPECFRCEMCNTELADVGFLRNAGESIHPSTPSPRAGRALCRECNAKEKAAGLGKYVCHKCHAIIDEGHIKWRGEAYHPYHYNCKQCGFVITFVCFIHKYAKPTLSASQQSNTIETQQMPSWYK
jgi:hypothetical protein